MTDGLAVQNENGVLTFVNDRFCEISGYPSHEAIGMGVMDFLDEKNQNILKAHIDDRKKGLHAESYELELTRKDKTKISLLVSPKGLYTSDGKYKGSFAIFSDITFLKLTENMLLETQKQLEEKVKERTRELEEKNVALKVLLTQRGDDKKKLEETMMSNVKNLLLPNLSRLKHAMAGPTHLAALDMLEANLNEIISPFMEKGSALFKKLTPMEIEVANFIKHGASTKDIAESLGLSRRTIDTHRYNIRKKIGISGKGVNLRTYLSNLS
jgi:PAS domain S-box-containing protein